MRGLRATLVSGYFQPARALWREPIYRDVWGLLREFGDADIAADRPAGWSSRPPPPEVAGPPRRARRTGERRRVGSVTAACRRLIRPRWRRLDDTFRFGSTAVGRQRYARIRRSAHCPARRRRIALARRESAPFRRPRHRSGGRMHRQFDQLVAYTQRVIAESPQTPVGRSGRAR